MKNFLFKNGYVFWLNMDESFSSIWHNNPCRLTAVKLSQPKVSYYNNIKFNLLNSRHKSLISLSNNLWVYYHKYYLSQDWQLSVAKNQE